MQTRTERIVFISGNYRYAAAIFSNVEAIGSDTDRLRNETHLKSFHDPLANLARKRDNLKRGCASTINDRKSVLSRDTNTSPLEAARETGVLDKPSRRDFDVPVGRREARRPDQLGSLLFGNNRIFEK